MELMIFLEGLLTFISPCLLPMLPVYYLYLAGEQGSVNVRRTFLNALGFVVGFSLVFTALGMVVSLAGVAARPQWLGPVSGVLIILLGLFYLGAFHPLFLQREFRFDVKIKSGGFFSSVLLGATLSLGWTPCAGPLLASAMAAAAAAQSGAFYTLFLLLLYCLGLGIPFLLTGVLFQQLRGVISFLSANAGKIRVISGAVLILMGIFIATGLIRYISVGLS